MNEPTTTPIPTATKKPRKTRTPRAPRQIDPGIALIHADAAKQVAAYRSKQASAKILATILNKRLPQLTDNDKFKLRVALDVVVTPPLQMEGA
ncbi:hypothetical protein D4Q85_00195 [bacterium]|nr:MAG: hypothetical protein D4Q85_00195 [bacterium]